MQPTLPTISWRRASNAHESFRLLHVLFEPLGHLEGLAYVINEIIIGGEESVNMKRLVCHEMPLQSSRRSSGFTPKAPASLRTVDGWKPSFLPRFSSKTIVLGLISALLASSRCVRPCPMRSRFSLFPSKYINNSI